MVTLIFVGFNSVFNRFILEFRLKQQIRKQFETYLTKTSCNITKGKHSKLKLGGERKEVTFLFMDIVGLHQYSNTIKTMMIII